MNPTSSSERTSQAHQAALKRSQQINEYLSVAAGLRQSGETWAAVEATYRAYQLDRGQPSTKSAISSIVDDGAIRSVLQSCLNQVAEGTVPDQTLDMLLPSISEAERFKLLYYIFSRHDAVEFVEMPADGGWPEDAVRRLDHLRLSPSRLTELFAVSRATINVNPYQTALLRAGFFSLPSPYSERLVETRTSLFVMTRNKPCIFYHFVDQLPFFLLTHPFSGEPSALYLPTENCLIGRDLKRVFGASVPAFLKSLMTTFGTETARYLSAPERTLALLYGTVNHLGHTVLNEYDALLQCSDASLLESVQTVVTGSANFIHHDQLLPSLQANQTIRVSSIQEAYSAVVRNKLLLVRPSSAYRFSRRLGTGLAHAARRRESIESTKEYMRAAACFPLIWFEIRTNDRIWLSQAEGIPAIANELVRKFPHCGIILAGWSRSEDPTSPADEAMIRSDHALVEQIVSSVDPEVSLFNLTGLATSEKILWSLLPDVFSAVFSSGFLFPLGVGRKPGVIHSNGGFISRHRSGKIPIFEDCPKIISIPFSKVVEPQPNVHFHLRNHDVDWKVVYGAIIEALRVSLNGKLENLSDG